MIGKKLEVAPLKQLVFTALLAAMAMMLMHFGISFFPGARYLKYEPSGVIILLCGLLLGPAAALECAIVKCVLYFLSHGGSPFGHLSDLLSMICFSGTALMIICRGGTHGPKKRILGCVVSCVVTTVVMTLANYPILYLQYGMNAESVTVTLPFVIPFNILKVTLNSAVALLAYRPVYLAIRAVSSSRS